MELLTSLQEASGHVIDDLKKVLSKDRRTKQVLQKHLDIDDIENKTEFVNTLKFFVLNNRHVIEFVKTRTGVKDLSDRILKSLREIRPAELTQRNVDDLLSFVSVLFREYSYVQRSGISAHTRKELVDWANANGRYFNLSRTAQRELSTVPDLRPSRPIVLYRGLLFKSHDLQERKRYDGQLEIGKGLQFLRSVREGSRIVDLEWDRPSSWSTSRETAMRFAQFSSAQSNFSATAQWLSRSAEGRKIDGDLGFIVSMLVQPDDVLIDMDRLKTAAHLTHGDEGEMILKPGKYTCRVNTKYSQKGEVDLDSPESDLTSLVEAIREFGSKWNVQSTISEANTGWTSNDVMRTLRAGEFGVFKHYAKSSLRARLIEEFNELSAFYKDHLAKIPENDLHEATADRKHGKLIAWAVSLMRSMTETRRHVAFKESGGKAKAHELSGEQYRESFSGSMTAMLKKYQPGVRFTDNWVSSAFSDLARGLKLPDDRDIHRRSKEAQQKAIDEIMSKFFETLGVSRPETNEEAFVKLKNYILVAERNSLLETFLVSTSTSLQEALSSE